MKNTTTTEKYVVKVITNFGTTEVVGTEREFAFIEDAEKFFNFNSKNVKVFKRKVIVEEEEIPTESTD
jgi:hypothetical protein